MLEGTLTTIRGFRIRLRGWTRAMSWRSMVWATSKLAMTPSLRGRTTSMLPGVRPSMALAAWPTAITDRCVRSSATMEGSDSTIPWPRTYTSVLAVPRSIPMSLTKTPDGRRNFIKRSLRAAAMRRGSSKPRA